MQLPAGIVAESKVDSHSGCRTGHVFLVSASNAIVARIPLQTISVTTAEKTHFFLSRHAVEVTALHLISHFEITTGRRGGLASTRDRAVFIPIFSLLQSP